MDSPPIDLTNADAIIELFELAATALRESPVRRGSVVRLPARGRLLATGDLHDNIIHLQKILSLAKLKASPDHHVVLHELIHGENLINGMDFSHRMLARVAQLVLAHPGQVHPLLANHELAQLSRRGVSKGAGNSVELFREALEYVFGPDSTRVATAIDGFILAMPLALLSESGVFCAHSLPGERTRGTFDEGVLNRELQPEDYHYPTGSAYLMTWGRAHSETLYRTLAKAWDVRLFCLGHQHAEMGIELKWASPPPALGNDDAPRHDPEDRHDLGVIVLNSDHERATVLPIDLARPPSAEEALMTAVPLASVGNEPVA